MSRPPATIVGYFGPKGSGKTTRMMRTADARRRVLVHQLVPQSILSARAIPVDAPGDLVRRLRAADGRKVRLAWNGYAHMDRAEAFEIANAAAWAAENITVVWDEIDLLAGRELPRWASMIVNAGRHRGISILYTARRPARVPRDLTANADRIVAFGTREPNDVAYLREFMGQAAEGLGDLPEYRAVTWPEKKSAS